MAKTIHLLQLFLAVFCLGVGLSSCCSQKTFEDSTKSCVYELFSALKENPKQDCRALYAKLKACIQSVVDECRNKTDDENFSRIVSRYDLIIASPEYYCQDGMLNTFKGYNLPDCREGTLKKVKKCVASFHGKFRENRGGQSLCRKYSNAKKCVKRTLEKFCQKTKLLQNLLRLYQDNYNPYCPGMVDRKRKRPIFVICQHWRSLRDDTTRKTNKFRERGRQVKRNNHLKRKLSRRLSSLKTTAVSDKDRPTLGP